MISARDIHFSYSEQEPEVLSGLSLSVPKNEVVALLGPSGCGKSTFLRILAGLLEPSRGTIDKPLELTCGFVFQEASLMPWATVQENILLPQRLKGEDATSNIASIIDALGISDLQDRYPAELSGGQKMRVSIARALASEPDILLMDEPFAALDEILRFQMNDLILQLQKNHSIPIILVTHSLYEACYLADTVYTMDGGKLSGHIRPALDRANDPNAIRSSKAFMDAVQSVSTLLSKAAA